MTRRPLSVVVMGGGVAGLAAGLALGRDGHSVTLIERDDLAIAGPVRDRGDPGSRCGVVGSAGRVS